jgi:hypothetical protein
MLTSTNVVLVDGARGVKHGGKSYVLQQLQELLPNAVRYEAALHHEDVDTATGAILRPFQGLDVSQARLGALDFLEQVPVDQVVLFDRSPLSSVVYEPKDPSSFDEVRGWMHRVKRGNLRQLHVLVRDEDAAGVALEEQIALETAYETHVLVLGMEYPRMHLFEARTYVEDRRMRCAVVARHLTPTWNYR